MQISIHAPREGSDTGDIPLSILDSISIHAPREGSDPAAGDGGGILWNFNPRSP